MVRTIARVVALLLGIGAPGDAFAQPPAAVPDPPKEPTSLTDRLKQPPDQGGGLHVTEHWAVAFGGIKQGSAIALGPAFSNKFANGSYVQMKAVYSIKHFRLLQVRYDTRRFWKDRAIIINRVRWQVAPELSLYRLGMDSPEARVDYGERKTEVSSQASARIRPHLRLAGGFGVERFTTSNGRIDLQEDESLPDIPVLPGLGAHPWYAHSVLSAAFDSRTSPDYSRSGSLLSAAIHDYRDLRDNQDSFEMYEAGAQRLVPMFAERGVLELSGRGVLAQSTGPRSVPFYLMPTLGGGDFLRAFPTYRFRDRNAWYGKVEYRWAVHKMADVAGLYEAGKVASTVGRLDFTDVAHSLGLGIRVHSKTANLFRADVAHGREGFGFRIGFNAGGS